MTSRILNAPVIFFRGRRFFEPGQLFSGRPDAFLLLGEALDDFLVRLARFSQTQFLVAHPDVKLSLRRQGFILSLFHYLLVKSDRLFQVAFGFFFGQGFLK